MNVEFLKRKISLGTVQLGMPYGINNKTGKPSETEALLILSKAEKENIHLLDSAEAYGDSLDVIGLYLKERKHSSFNIISKFIGNEGQLTIRVEKTLGDLGKQRLYGYLFHRFSDYLSGNYMPELLRLKQEGKINKIGVSIYSISELKSCMADPDISIVQVPFNPFDSSEEKKKLLAIAKDHGKEIHARSIFLQGLFFKNGSALLGNLQGFSHTLSLFHNLLKEYGVDVRQACLNYALHQPYIDQVVIGVETVGQLEENLAAISTEIKSDFIDSLGSLPTPDPYLLNPSNWIT